MSEKNREAFRNKQQEAASFLANELKFEMKVKLADYDFADWVREAAKLVKDYDPMEVADAMVWAVHESDFWSDWDFTMAKFVQYSEKIIAQYRGSLRKKKALDRANGTEKYSESCLVLMAKYPNWTRAQIRDREVYLRWKEEWDPINKACTRCKGTNHILSTHANPRLHGIKIECPDCRAAKADLFHKHIKALQMELWGYNTPAYA